MPDMTLVEALSGRRTCREFASRAVPAACVQRLLWAAQGLTGDAGNRTVPSAHALHPLRLMVVAGDIESLMGGIHSADDHLLELTLIDKRDVRRDLEHAALDDQPWIAAAAGILVICGDLAAPATAFADQPPVGQRGPRYVYLEAGAAMQNVLLQAAAEGLACVPVAGFKDEATADVLGLEPPLVPIVQICFGWPGQE